MKIFFRSNTKQNYFVVETKLNSAKLLPRRDADFVWFYPNTTVSGSISLIHISFCLELPCYTTSHYNTSSDAAKITWPVACIAVLIVIGVTMAVYLMYRRQQKDRLTTGNFLKYIDRAQRSSWETNVSNKKCLRI